MSKITHTIIGAQLTVLLLASFTLIAPAPVAAQSTSCPQGSTLQFVDQPGTGGLGSNPIQTPQCVDAQGNVVQPFTGSLGAAANQNQAIAAQLTQNAQPVPTQCSVTITNLGALINPICWGRTIGAIIAGFIVSIASWMLTLSGMLFNWALNITIVQFGQFMTSTVLASITTVWAAFRDISNIVIIGVFTFIAISIILGLKEFGQKKLIARVLIIAVLINFSLLFTKLVIDASNYTATQFYDAALNQTAGANTTNSTTQFGLLGCGQAQTNAQCYGIAGAFMDYAGVSGFGDTRKAVSNLADQLDNGVSAFIFAVFTALVFLGAAAVLFYGTFLLLSRAILFIFLLAISAMAFASYIVPAWAKSEYGFTAWRKTLVNNALLAPLLMLFLWMTLNVAIAMKSAPGGGTLGDLIANPTKSIDINAFFDYAVVLGLLFASFKMSSKFSSKIGGFGFAQNLTALPLALGNHALSMGLRATRGRRAASREEEKKDELRSSRNKLATLGAEMRNFTPGTQGHAAAEVKYQEQLKKTAALADQAAKAGKIADSKMNVMDTIGGKKVAEQMGLKGFFSGASGKNTQSYAGGFKASRDEALKAAEKVALSNDDIAKVRKGAEDTVVAERGSEKRRLETERDIGRRQIEGMRATLAPMVDASKSSQENLEKLEKDRASQQQLMTERVVQATQGDADLADKHAKLKKAEEDLQKTKDYREKELGTIKDPETRKVVERQLVARGASESDMRHETERIDKARQEIVDAIPQERLAAIGGVLDHQDIIKKLDDAITTQKDVITREADLKELQTKIEAHGEKSTETAKAVKDAADAAERNLREGTLAAVEEIGKRHGNILQKALNKLTGDDEKLGKAALGEFKRKQGAQYRLAQVLKEQTDGAAKPEEKK